MTDASVRIKTITRTMYRDLCGVEHENLEDAINAVIEQRINGWVNTLVSLPDTTEDLIHLLRNNKSEILDIINPDNYYVE